jgi:hypothetical protein
MYLKPTPAASDLMDTGDIPASHKPHKISCNLNFYREALNLGY